MSSVFISYVREDIKFAKKLYDDLKKVGFDAWLDQEDLLPGQEWKIAIKDKIDHCSIFLPIISKSSVTKTGFYQGEIKHAFARLENIPPGQIFIIPVRIDDYDPYGHPLFRQLNFADLFTDYKLGFSKLKNALITAVGYVDTPSVDFLQSMRKQIVSYFDLKSNLLDQSIYRKNLTYLPINSLNNTLSYTSDGISFDRSFVLQLQNENIPTKGKPRTFCLWVKFENDIPEQDNYDTPRFIFSYGKEVHDKSFGLFYGIPFFSGSIGYNKYGFRIFTWCNPLLYQLGDTGCDSDEFSTAALSNWYHISISYDGASQRAYINGNLVLTQDRTYETESVDLLNIGGFLPGREADYHTYLFCGNIRQFLIFDTVLTDEEVNNVYTETRQEL